MAAPERAIPRAISPTITDVRFETPASDRPAQFQNDLVRLAALHREASDTARLANLLSRAPMAAIGLSAAAALTAAWSFTLMPAAQIVVWLMLVGLAAAAVARAYHAAIRAPFERGPLTRFAEDFKAILTYAGFAWGAGAFLVLPADAGALAATLFLAAPALLLSVMLRARSCSVFFATPAAALGCCALLLRGLPAGSWAVFLTLSTAAAIALAALAVQRRETQAEPAFTRLPA